MIDVIQNNNEYIIKFPYNRAIIDLIKNVPGRKWNRERKYWSIPKDNLGWFINIFGDTVFKSSIRIQSEEHLNQNQTLDADTIIPDIDISDMKQYVKSGGKLYQHQIDFLKYAKSRQGKGFILADEMGCGKTLELMNYALYMRERGYKHCLIICCVNAAKYNWQDDIEKHTNGEEYAYILGTRPYKRKSGYKYNTGNEEKLEDILTGKMYGDKDGEDLPYFIVTNVETLRMQNGKKKPFKDAILNMINSGNLSMIAIDEVHKNVSPQSAQGKVLLDIKKRSKAHIEFIPITGTPIVNKPTDVFTPLRLVNGHNITAFSDWKNQFCIYGNYGTNSIIGYKNIDILKKLLQNNMIRRLSSQVLDLPDKTQYVEYVENTPIQQKLYDAVSAELEEKSDDILSNNVINPLSMLLRLRQVNGSPELIDPTIQVDISYVNKNAKLKRLIELVDEIVERGEKVVIFSNWVEELRTMYKFLSVKYKTACYVGTMKEADREKNKRVFINNPDYKIMLGSIGAMGVSITLTVANNVIFYSEPWNYATKDQAEKRCHRIGTDKRVNVYTIITKGTVDEHVHKIIFDKKDMSGYIVDGDLDIRKNPELFSKLIRMKK